MRRDRKKRGKRSRREPSRMRMELKMGMEDE